MNAPVLPGNWFWRVGLVGSKFYCLEVSLKDASFERFPTLSKKIYISIIVLHVVYFVIVATVLYFIWLKIKWVLLCVWILEFNECIG